MMFRIGRMPLTILVVLSLVAVLALTGCTQPADDAAGDDGEPAEGGDKQGGKLVIARLREPDTLDPHKTPWLDDLIGSMHDTYLYRDKEGGYVGGLAKDWQISDDELSLTITLREDVKFHDGEPLNAEAAKATFERMMDPEMNSPGLFNLGPVDNVEVVDEYTFKINYEKTFALALNSMTSSYLSPMSPKAFEEQGEDFGQNPVGCGPFKFESWESGSELRVVRNPDYNWGPEIFENQGAPYVDEIVFKFIPDETARVTGLETGELDVITQAPPRDVLRLDEDENYEVHHVLATGIIYLGTNSSKEPWTNIPLRQGIAWAASGRDEIIESAFDGLAEPIYGPLAPHIKPGYYEGIEEISYKRDVDKAKSIFEEQGYTMGDDGFYQKDGETLEAEVWITNNPLHKRIAVVLQEQLAEAGFKLNITQMDNSTLFASTQEGRHDMILAYYGYTDPDILYYFFHSDRLDSTNRVHYVNDRVDELLIEGRSTLDNEERHEIYKEVQEILIEEAPWVPLVVAEEPVVTSDKVNNFNIHPITKGFMLNDVSVDTE